MPRSRAFRSATDSSRNLALWVHSKHEEACSGLHNHCTVMPLLLCKALAHVWIHKGAQPM
jgi:hypothetical protein